MKNETRVELAILIILAVLLGGWLGWRLIGSDETNSDTPGEPAQAKALATAGSVSTQPVGNRTVAQRTSESKEEPANPPRQVEKARTASHDTHLTPPAIKAGLAEAEALLADEKPGEARSVLTRLILSAPEGPAREKVKAELVALNDLLFFSRNPSEHSVTVTVQPGDSLALIAKRQGKDYYFAELIKTINGITDEKRLRLGRKLKIPKGTFSAIVQKRAHRLIIFLEGDYIKEYPIAIGAPITPTPEETFTIATKQPNPDWYAPDGNLYKYGHPKNVLGTRWLGFAEKGEYQSYGIHGTNDPNSIGKNVSNGCVRMLNEDVEEIFSMLQIGDKVQIVK